MTVIALSRSLSSLRGSMSKTDPISSSPADADVNCPGGKVKNISRFCSLICWTLMSAKACGVFNRMLAIPDSSNTSNWLSRSQAPKAMAACPHIGYSVRGEKNLVLMMFPEFSVIKHVAGAPTSRAIFSISVSLRSAAWSTIPAAQPPKGELENAL